MVRVACCWDDGVETDIRLVEMLHKYGAKATFNLNYGLHYKNYRMTAGWQFPENSGFINRKLSLQEMPQVYQGFKIASHGYFHADCFKVSTTEYVVDAVECRSALEDLFQQKIYGFVYGCGRATPAAAAALATAGFAYGRTTENTNHVLAYDNPLLLKSSAHMSHENFIAAFEQAKQDNDIFYFWGHSCEMQDVEAKWQAMEEKFAYIAADPNTQWIDVIDIVKPRVG